MLLPHFSLASCEGKSQPLCSCHRCAAAALRRSILIEFLFGGNILAIMLKTRWVHCMMQFNVALVSW